MTYGRVVEMGGNKGRGNKKVWNREEQVWRVESSQATPSSKPSQSERGTYLHSSFKPMCGTVWFGLVCSERSPHESEDEIIHLTFSKPFCQNLITKGQKA